MMLIAISCDNCGVVSEPSADKASVKREQLAELGWCKRGKAHAAGDLCPECKPGPRGQRCGLTIGSVLGTTVLCTRIIGHEGVHRNWGG